MVQTRSLPDEGAKPPLAELSTPRLLAQYGEILAILRARGITRTEDSPVGGYAEHLAARAFGLSLNGNSSSGYDGLDDAGIRYQVKGRRITRWNPSRQLSAIRGLGEGSPDPFDQLIGILFNGDFTILRAAMVPLGVVRSQARLQAHVNGWRFMLTDAIWTLPGVRDVTKEIATACLSDTWRGHTERRVAA